MNHNERSNYTHRNDLPPVGVSGPPPPPPATLDRRVGGQDRVVATAASELLGDVVKVVCGDNVLGVDGADKYSATSNTRMLIFGKKKRDR